MAARGAVRLQKALIYPEGPLDLSRAQHRRHLHKKTRTSKAAAQAANDAAAILARKGGTIGVPRKETAMTMSLKTLALMLTLAAFLAVHIATIAKLQAADPAQLAVTYVHGAD
jgi:hypothetical protein